MGILALLAGVVFIVLAGLIFATTAWQVLTNPAKVLLVLVFAGLFFGTSVLAEKRLHIHKTGNALYILGSIFLFLSVLAAAYFRLLGPMYILDGQNRWRVLWVGSLVTVTVLFLGIRRFDDRIYTQVCCWGMTVSITFLMLAHGMNRCSEWLSSMMIYAFLLISGQWGLERLRRRQKLWEGTKNESQKRQGKGWELLAEGFSWFAPLHFWIFAFPTIFLVTIGGFFQVAGWFRWRIAIALGAVLLGNLWQLDERFCEWKKIFFSAATAGAVHYLLAWLCLKLSDGKQGLIMETFLLAEMAAALCLIVGQKRKFYFQTRAGEGIHMGFLLLDALILNVGSCLRQIWEGGYIQEPLWGSAGKALAGALVLTAVIMVRKKGSMTARLGFPFLLWYVVSCPLGFWLRCGVFYYFPEEWRWMAADWIGRGGLEFILLCGLIARERKKREGYHIPILALGTVMQAVRFSAERVALPFFLLLSGYLWLEAPADKKWAVMQKEAAAFYAMLGTYLLLCPFTADNLVLRLTGVAGAYALCLAVHKRWVASFELPEGRTVFWDACGCLLAAAMVMAYYESPALKAWNLALCLAVCGGCYGMFYLGKQIWPHLIISLAWMPMPFVLMLRYGWTENQINGITLASLALTGIAARCRFRIWERDERVFGGWRVDWYHVLAGFVLALLAARSESAYWRFVLILILALYFLQYAAVKGWKRLAWSAAAFMLVLAFWNQPFGELPSMVWMEIQLLPAAGYLWGLGKIWRGKTLQKEGLTELEIMQTTGYLLCLLILTANAWIRGEVVNALILEGICLTVFVWALVKHCRRWIGMSGTILILVALYMTKGFWLSISWWVYLLGAGIGLVVLAGIMEKKER